jgi:hypothetical protein
VVKALIEDLKAMDLNPNTIREEVSSNCEHYFIDLNFDFYYHLMLELNT